MTQKCELCEREVPKLTVHHLRPRQTTKRKKAEIGPTASICSACYLWKFAIDSETQPDKVKKNSTY